LVGTCPHAEAARKAHGLVFEEPKKFSYEAFYANELEKKHKDKSYRYFNNINRVLPLPNLPNSPFLLFQF
jgi:5-aminolevulinate synthase